MINVRQLNLHHLKKRRASSAGMTTAGGERGGVGEETHLVIPPLLLTEGPWGRHPNTRDAEHTRITVCVRACVCVTFLPCDVQGNTTEPWKWMPGLETDLWSGCFAS